MVSPVSANQRKHLRDGESDAPRKAQKTGHSMPGPRTKVALRIVTDIPTVEMDVLPLDADELQSSPDTSDDDSLFDEPPPPPDIDGIRSALTSDTSLPEPATGPDGRSSTVVLARRTAPPIPGLYFDPAILLPDDLAEDVMWRCIRAYFQTGSSDQVMLFERASASPIASPAGLPPFLSDLLTVLQDLLRPLVPPEAHELLFSPSPATHRGPPRARQAIINLYCPGDGITPHVDLLSRYGDGIIGVSFGSGCAMDFAPAREGDTSPLGSAQRCALYLPKGSVLVFTGPARYEWTHGIEKRWDDLVEEVPGGVRGVLLERNIRLSVTFRWMLPGAEVVGSAAPSGGA